MRYYLLTLATMLFACCSSDHEAQAETLQTTSGMTISITIDGQTQTVTLADNAATQALVAKLQEGPVTLSLPSGTTAIHHVGTTAKDDAYYSLTGQKVEYPSHGIYIRNGRKVAL
jgi:hypothetical protein